MAWTQFIYYAIYAIYLAWIFGWFGAADLNQVDTETILLAMTVVLVMLLLLICLLFGTNWLGLTKYSTTVLVVALVTVLVFTMMVIGYQYLNSYQSYGSTIEKVKQLNLQPKQFLYQYGRDSEEIGRRLGVNNSTIFNRPSPLSLQETWEKLMKNPAATKQIVHEILGANLNDDLDVYYNLLWYLSISEDPFGNNLYRQDLKNLVTLKPDELFQMFPPDYEGARDRASLIFTILSGQMVPRAHYSHDRYQEIKQYTPAIVYNLTFQQYGHPMIDHQQGTYVINAPYIHLAEQNKLLVEDLLLKVKPSDCDQIIEAYGLLPANSWPTMTAKEKLAFVQGELSLYHQVIKRPKKLPPPPEIANLNREEIAQAITFYTNAELIAAYDPRGYWSSRSDLIRLIQDDVTGVPRWAFANTFCCNDQTINILTGELHGELDKNDVNDPILSFGTHKNYRCYTISELLASFREYNGVFMFHVPDWTNQSVNVRREFPLESFKQLLELLEVYQGIYSVTELKNKIAEGLALFQSAGMKTRSLRLQYQDFTAEQKALVQKYLAWMFMHGMWMRFWKGPGYPWPMKQVNIKRQREREQAQRCSAEERDEHVFIQEAVRTAIIEEYERDNYLKNWLEDLSTIYYDFETKVASCAVDPIRERLDKVAIGELCMGWGSDTILKTAYFYIVHLLGAKEGQEFNQFIAEQLPIQMDLELQVINTQLLSLNNQGVRRTVLTQRLQAIEQMLDNLPRQPPFSPEDYQNNIHV